MKGILQHAAVALLLLCPAAVVAEDGSAAWLRYAPIANAKMYASLPSRIVVFGDTATEKAAGAELARGLSSMLGRNFMAEQHTDGPAFPLNTAAIVISHADPMQHFSREQYEIESHDLQSSGRYSSQVDHLLQSCMGFFTFSRRSLYSTLYPPTRRKRQQPQSAGPMSGTT